MIRRYLRRSRDDHQAHSIDTQREGVSAFVAGRMTELVGQEVFALESVEYRDDDSGGEFLGRDGLQRLLREARQDDFVVCRDISRLGRDMLETVATARELVQRGVRIFFYDSQSECLAKTPEQLLMLAIQAFGPHKERDAIRSRTKEALRRRIRMGRVAGGKCFGYLNVRKKDEEGRDYTVQVILEAEAEVVRWIFEQRAKGLGYRTIAGLLNERGVPSSRAGKRGTGHWVHSAVRSIITNCRYRGLIRHGEWIKVDRGGRRVRVRAPEEDVMKVRAEHLRIVSDELWWAVQPPKRAQKAPDASLTAPRPRRSPNRRHPLSGVGRCAECGGPMIVANSKTGQDKRLVYCCGWRRDRGKSVCSNKLRRPKDVVEATVADYLLEEVLTERMVAEVVRRVRDRLAERTKVDESGLRELETELRSLDGEIRRLVDTIAVAPDSTSLLDGLRRRERRRNALAQEIEIQRRTPAAVAEELKRLEEDAHRRLESVRNILVEEQQAACQLVEALFPSGLTFTPDRSGKSPRYLIRGDAVVGPGILSGRADDDVILSSVPSEV